MLFQSPLFTLFYGGVLLLVVVLRGRTARHVTLLLASYAFYAAWDARFLALLFASTLVDYVAGRRIHVLESRRARRAWVVLSLAANLGILGFFKYCNFFTSSAAELASAFGLELHRTTLDIVLPVGISFYTFQSISYTLDVHAGRLQPERSFLRFALYVAFFPQLVAGPIVRARTFLPQLRDDAPPRGADLAPGLLLFSIGLFKKIVIADHMARAADPVFAAPDLYGSWTLAFAVLAYAVQIYCDFSGYSDMAIGVGRILGYRLPRNFDRPYAARNPREFWSRWHISLSTWLRDYLYIPLGGSRAGAVRTHLNLMTTMVLGGLWHGANWTFVAWGFVHGSALSAHRLLAGKTAPARRLASAGSWALMFGTVLLAWIGFRAESLGSAAEFLSRMFAGRGGVDSLPAATQAFQAVLILCVAVGQSPFGARLERTVKRWHATLKMFAAGALAGTAYSISAGEAHAFIYFQF